ncbi:MAG: hypothetical protein KDA25_02105, partial [Phycisphaerales bacterium]|nr:hypothetical protein [Phycisphaerales bacterium]
MSRHDRPSLLIAVPRRRARRGSVYMLVVFVSMLLMVIGVGAVLASRADTKRATLQRDTADAALLAQAAVELGTSAVYESSLWRTLLSNDTFGPAMPFGRGTIRWKVIDDDGALLDDFQDPVWVHGRGTVGSTTYTMRVRCTFGRGEPYTTMNVPMWGNDFLEVGPGASVSVSNGPLCAPWKLYNYGVVTGNVEAGSVAGGGTVTGTTTAATARTFPPASTFDTWANAATEIPWATVAANGNVLSTTVLSAGAAPWSAADPAGVYFIDVPSRAVLTIRISRISGSLIVNLGSQADLIIDAPMTWQSYDGNQPILLVRGNRADITIACSSSSVIRESIVGNLNPPGSPYAGATDNDTADLYSPTLAGLIAIWNPSGVTTIGNATSIRGIVMVEGEVVLGASSLGTPSVTFNYDAAIAANPPAGFTGTSATGVVPS